MNLPFILVICFGVAVVGIIIAQIVFNAIVSRSSGPAPWMRRVRQFQDKTENAGWRIQMIPYQAPDKPMVVDSSGAVSVVPVIGALGFLTGLALVTYDKTRFATAGLVIIPTSLVLMFVGVWLKARREHQGWDVVRARCIDRELQKVLMPAGAGHAGSSWAWIWRIVCEYDYLGSRVRVTPTVQWMGSPSEEAALKYLEERVSPSGECLLRINPKNPLQADLFDQGIRDKLLGY